jgi:hypothetical protein
MFDVTDMHGHHGDGRRAAAVQVIFPQSQIVRGKASSVAETGSIDHVPSASSTAADSSTLTDKAIAGLPPDHAEQANDSKRKAKSQDPSWKFGWWPDPSKKEFVQCIFCMKVVPSGIKRFKQHLTNGFGDTMKCARVPEVVSNDIQAYLKKNTRSALVLDDDGSIEGEDDATTAPVQFEPSSGTKYKQAK